MTIIGLLVFVLICYLVWWLTTKIPDASVRTVVQVVLAILAIIWLLQALGVLGGLGSIRLR
jgi:uncharacterized membrane protein YGL010W